MRRAFVVCTAALAFAGCKGLPDPCASYSDETCIALQIERAPDVAAFSQIEVTPLAGISFGSGGRRSVAVDAEYPLLLAVVPSAQSTSAFQLRVDGYGFDSTLSATTRVDATVSSGDHVTVRAVLDATGGGDLGPSADLAGKDQADPGLPRGAVCSSATMCVANSSCYPYFGLSLCRQSCTNDDDCTAAAPVTPANTAHCAIAPIGTTTSNACTVPCNPVPALGPSGCVSGLLCYVYPISGVPTEATNCINAGSGAEGSSCTATTQCAEGQTCVGPTGDLHCRHVCRKGNDADCSAPQVCKAITGRTLFGACCPSAGC